MQFKYLTNIHSGVQVDMLILVAIYYEVVHWEKEATQLQMKIPVPGYKLGW